MTLLEIQTEKAKLALAGLNLLDLTAESPREIKQIRKQLELLEIIEQLERNQVTIHADGGVWQYNQRIGTITHAGVFKGGVDICQLCGYGQDAEIHGHA